MSSEGAKAWLEVDSKEGVKSTTLVVNTTERFEQSFDLEAAFMNVRDSPSIKVTIKVGASEDESVDSLVKKKLEECME